MWKRGASAPRFEGGLGSKRAFATSAGAAGALAGGICHRRQVRGHVPGAARQVVELIGSSPP